MGKINRGYITWPDRRFTTDPLLGGMWVYAFWLADYTEPVDAGLNIVNADITGLARDPFIHCSGPEHTIMLPKPERALRGGNVYPSDLEQPPVDPTDPDALARGTYLRHTLDAGVPVLAAICLGSTAKVYVNGTQDTYWAATPKDLNRRGRKLMKALSDLFGADRPVELVTYVDFDPA